MILFFDIDGTLWDRYNQIPESTMRSIRAARAKGHLCFLNSGRSRAFIHNEALLSIGFDGIVSACGTMIEYQGETLFKKAIPKALSLQTVETVRRFGFRPILEGAEYLYLSEEEFTDDAFAAKLKRELGERLLDLDAHWGRWDIQKLSCATEHADRDACLAQLSSDFDFMIHNEAVLEIVPKGFHKGTGIQKVCDLLGVPLSETFAFGDSINDKEMLETAGTGIAMGNGTEAAKAAADYVTAPMDEDGIEQALQKFQLL